jgi:hypothetical protein
LIEPVTRKEVAMTRLEIFENLMSSKIGARLDDLQRQYNSGKVHGLVAFVFDGWQTRMLTAGDVDDESMANWFRLLGESYGGEKAIDDAEAIGIAA